MAEVEARGAGSNQVGDWTFWWAPTAKPPAASPRTFDLRVAVRTGLSNIPGTGARVGARLALGARF